VDSAVVVGGILFGRMTMQDFLWLVAALGLVAAGFVYIRLAERA
jgi:hypothetical protein